MNKKILILTAALILPLNAFAHNCGEGDKGFPEHRLEHLTKELSLSDDQKAKLEVVFKEQHEKFKAFHEESNNRVKEVLSPEQIAKWEAMKKHHHGKHHKKPVDAPVQTP
jgi:Spy/CpxP family protein refolding chaperone